MPQVGDDMVNPSPAMTVALMMAKEVCSGCVCCEYKVSPRMLSHSKVSCPFFYLDNFYYDGALGHFWCYNWIDSKGTPSRWN